MSTINQYQKRKKKLFLLLGNKCKQCGSIENLEFDHIDPTTKIATITEIWGYSFKRVLEELKKCQLLCRNCHKAKTKIQMTKFQHGTLGAYRHHRCRCEKCKYVWNFAVKRWKAKNNQE